MTQAELLQLIKESGLDIPAYSSEDTRLEGLTGQHSNQAIDNV